MNVQEAQDALTVFTGASSLGENKPRRPAASALATD
jgi:hypothetical protein